MAYDFQAIAQAGTKKTTPQSSSVASNQDLQDMLDSITRKEDRFQQAGIQIPQLPSQLKKLKPTLSSIFDLLSRGEYLSATTVGEILKHGELPTGQEFRDALTGKTKNTYDKLLGDLGMEKGWKRSALGLGLGIGLDPLTYIPVGGIMGKAGKYAGKGISKLPGGASALSKLDDIVKTGKSAVGIKSFADDGIKELDTTIKGVSARVGRELGKTGKRFEDLIDTAGVLSKDEMGMLRMARENPELVAKLSDEGKRALDLLDDMLGTTGMEKVQSGLSKGFIGSNVKKAKQLALDDKIGAGSVFDLPVEDALDYLPHMTTPEFFEKVIKEQGANSDEMYEVVRGLMRNNLARVDKKRNLFGTIDELNKWSNKKYGVNMFQDDMSKIINGYLYSYSKNKALNEMAQDMLKITDNAGDTLIKPMTKAEPAEGLVKLTGFPFKGQYQTTPEVAQMINKVNGVLSSDVALNKALRAFDKGMRAWKTVATVYSPGAVSFNATNYLGASMNNWIQSQSSFDPKNLQQTIGLMTGKPMTITAKNGATMTGEQFADEMLKRGALSTHVGMDTFLRDASKLGSKLNANTKLNQIVKAPAQMAEGVERFVRYQIALDTYKRTGSLSDAVRTVWKVHGNYAPEALTTAEKGLKRVFPFYVWMRTNIPFQIENLYKQTGKYATIAKTERALTGGVDPDSLPEWTKDKFKIGAGESPSGKKTVTTLDLPVNDLSKMLSVSGMASGINPFIKTPAELAFNKSLFTGREIYDEDLPPEMRTVKVPDWVAVLPEPIKKAMNIKQSNLKNRSTGESEPVWEADAVKWYALMSTAAPVSRFSYASKRAQDTAELRGDPTAQSMDVLQQLAMPQRTYGYDPEQQQYWEAYAQDKEMQEIINYLRQRGLIE